MVLPQINLKKKALKKTMELMPENPVYVGDRPASEMDLSVISYDSSSAQMKKLSDIDDLLQYKDISKTLWINISGLKDIDSIKRLGDYFEIHPLTIEDILNTEQQPKMEIFEEYRFLSFKTIQQGKEILSKQEGKKKRLSFFDLKRERNREDEDLFLIDQISIIIMKNVLITFQEITGDPFDGIRKKILDDIGEIRKAGADYLAYSIIDAVVDEYFLALNDLEDVIEDFEERATKTSDNTFIEHIQDIKKYLVRIKRAVLPLKNNMLIVSHHGTFFRDDDLKPFLQDLNEHLNDVITMVDTHREWLTNIMDVNLSVLSHQMNKVMKVLATISTIFIPLTFIAGVYGMNFQYMPELEYELAYPLVLGVMGLIALVMIAIFKTHRWF
jgi:magnesium transporter